MQQVAIDAIHIAAPFRFLNLIDQLIQVLHLVHELHGRLEVELFAAVETVLRPHRIEEIHFLCELSELRVEFRITKTVLHQCLQLLTLLCRHGVQ